MNETPPHPAIAKLAGELGLEARGGTILVPARVSSYREAAAPDPALAGPFPIEVSVEFDSGAVKGLSYSVATHALPEIVLRIELGGDRNAKRLGINREVQTGDATFDDRVYIDSEAKDEAVLAVLAFPEARKAVLELLERCGELRLSAAGIRTRTDHGALEAPLVRERIETLHRLAATLPSFEPAAVAVPPAPANRPLVAVMGLFFVASIGGAYSAERAFPLLRAMPLAPLGFGLGALLAVLALGIVAHFVRGKSNSMRVVVRSATYLFTTFIPAGYAATVAYNGLLGSSQRIVRNVVVASCGGDESHDVTVTWGHDQKADISVKGCEKLPAGTRLVLETRMGALGTEWVKSLRD